MGYLTTVILHNDAFHAFKEDPEQLGKAIVEGVYKAQREHRQIDIGFHGYANYLSVEPSRHADDHTVYVHYGNTVMNLNPWNKDFEELAKRDLDTAEDFVKIAQKILDSAKDKIKEERKLRKKIMKEIAKNGIVEKE